MRIIGGRYKRRILPSNTKLPIRPTTDKAKEALFNIINNYYDFESITVLDIFAGTGSISFEFASRGAIQVISVDINNKCVEHIKKTALNLNCDNIKVVRHDSLHFLKICTQTFDVIFADPPYTYTDTAQIPDIIMKKNLLNPEGLLIIEHPIEVDLKSCTGFFDQRKYGKTIFSFFKS